MAEDEDIYMGRGYDREQEDKSKSWKIGEIKDKEVNMAARDSDNAWLERFKLRSDKARLTYDKTLDIAGVGDVVLKTSFGTSWTLKDVRYIPALKRRLTSVRQLDKEGYHVGFRDQQWKVTKGSLVVDHGNKFEIMYMVEFGEAKEAFLHNVKEDKENPEVGASSYRRL
ncbi:hypothetical protein Tco_0355019 [Tanacetum coccineum]